MNNKNKVSNLKEKLKQALTSTVRFISEDFTKNKDEAQNKNSKNFDFFNIDDFNSKNDFLKLRAEADSSALKIKLSDNTIFKKNLPSPTFPVKLFSIIFLSL